MQFIDIIFCGIAYIILIFFVIKRYHTRNIGLDDDNDDDDGGIEVFNSPKLDLPPGVCLPQGPVRNPQFDEEPVH
jgi:hypothetical protein